MLDSEAVMALYPTRCAICGTTGDAVELYPANFDPDVFNAEIFSARRLPDGIRYRLVQCMHCGLVRSDPVADAETLSKLYAESAFTYDAEVDSLRVTYGRYLRALEQYGARGGMLLEVGCGNGFFLEEAQKQGYTVRGVEPSAEAIAKANPSMRDNIVCDILRPDLFAADSFDTICIFQTFDHLPDPGGVLDECWRVLKPGGLLLCLNHNIQAVSARLLHERSPIIDIEHTYLYSPKTFRRIFTDHRFEVRHLGRVFNTYPPHYLVRLLPMPRGMKQRVIDMLRRSRVGNVSLRVPLGNMYLVAQKPRNDAAIANEDSPNVAVFNRDAASNEGYLYTTNIRLSSQMATRRTADIILGLERFAGRRVLDIGCGDGSFTRQFWDRGHPMMMTAIDPAPNAIAVANENKRDRPIHFETGDAHHLQFADDRFDIALIQSVLHHDDDPKDIIREALRVAPEVLVHEPNGSNPGLKLIERIMPYHKEHNEKSYSMAQVARWMEECGARIVRRQYAGFVPMFSPDWLARAMKAAEPVIERVPGLRKYGCAVYVIVARRDG